MKCVLTVFDTVSIQPYIFSTNRLKEMIGASGLVEAATQDWVYQTLEDLWPGRHNVVDKKKGGIDDERSIENAALDLQAELIYAGGGNTLLIFRDMECARSFTAALTKKVLIRAPGLQLVAAHLPFNWSAAAPDESLGYKTIELIENQLAARKLIQADAQPMAGLAVTAACQSTGGPASIADRETGQRISRETAAKIKYHKQHNARMEQIFGSQLEGFYHFPLELDNLAPEERSESYLAVVHADGNGMGKLVRKIAMQPGDNRTFIKNLRLFSKSVQEASTDALRQVVESLARMNPDDLHPRGDFLPFRPLISGGDDITFVCRGDLGVSLAALYLENFEKATLKGLPDGDLHPYACAGISIVKLHFPFSHAYDLAEELCTEAKKEIKPGEDFSALDWHFSSTGISGSIKVIRRQYKVPEHGDLYLRPLRLYPSAQDMEGRAWYGRVEPLVAEFHKTWRTGRNKAKDLHEALRAGPEAVKEFLHTYELPGLPPIVPGSNVYVETGWSGTRCGYFDALELMDHYTRVDAGGK